jgi:hypothetical protein
MELPREILCEKCGASARVVTEQVDDAALAGQLPARDSRLREGFYFTIDCPQCGIRSQSLAPPP